MKYTNQENIEMSLALWLGHDPYKHNTNPLAFSSTELLRPLKSIVLSQRMPPAVSVDISSLIASRLGQAVHTAIEHAWGLDKNIRQQILKNIGIPESAIERILINPTPDKLAAVQQAIPIYIEKSFQKPLGKFTITGTADFISNGRLEDFKTTKCYSYQRQSSADKYIQQGSIYRWIAPEIITEDYMAINYVFMDYQASKKKWEKNYPPAQIVTQKYPLMSMAETEAFIRRKATAIDQHMHLPQEQLPLCTRKELWQDDPVFKYYKNPAATKRSTKNFTSSLEAETHRINMGVGIVKEVPGKAKFCLYCPAISICAQAEQLAIEGHLDI